MTILEKLLIFAGVWIGVSVLLLWPWIRRAWRRD